MRSRLALFSKSDGNPMGKRRNIHKVFFKDALLKGNSNATGASNVCATSPYFSRLKVSEDDLRLRWLSPCLVCVLNTSMLFEKLRSFLFLDSLISISSI